MKLGKKFFVILYTATIILFVLYLGIFSDDNFAKHRELNLKIADLNSKIHKTKNQINNEYNFEEMKNNPQKLEQYAREQKNMHFPDEDVFIIVYE